MVRELRDKSAYPPTYLTLRCELAPFYKGAALAEGAMWAACREHLVGDLSDYLQCDELQLVLQGEEDTLTPEAMRPACLVRLFVVPSMNERVGEPRELIDALRSSIVSMGRDFTSMRPPSPSTPRTRPSTRRSTRSACCARSSSSPSAPPTRRA